MSEQSDADTSALRHEYEALSSQASTIASTLARRRADISLMRAEAATVAVSLESAKEQLDTALRSESVIRSSGPSVSTLSPMAADFQPDLGLIRALSGQLEVTRDSVRAAEEKRNSLNTQIEQLERQDNKSWHEKSPRIAVEVVPRPVQLTSAPYTAFAHSTIPDEGDAVENRFFAHSMSTERRRDALGVVEENVLQTLKDGSQAHSSYRSDHARIWRDVKMPNLGLVRQDSDPDDKSSDIAFGVVTERIFEGVTCFTPNTSDIKISSSAPRDMRIESKGEPRKPSKSIYDRFVGQFGFLGTRGKDDGPDARIIAPKKALDRVLDLIKSGGTSSSNQKPPVPTGENVEEHTVPTIPIEASEAAHETEEAEHPESRKKSRQEEKVEELSNKMKARLSGSSKVLSNNQFAQIILDGVPARFQESALDLVYSTDLHGMSLNTLYHRASKKSPTLIAIRDTRNRVFGCYAAHPWKSSSTRYYGSGESFVFGTPDASSATVYKWSRLNSFFQFTSSNFLALGGGTGSHFALWFDEDLLMGTTSACSTFSSPPLSDPKNTKGTGCTEFKILSLEVWSFETHRRH